MYWNWVCKSRINFFARLASEHGRSASTGLRAVRRADSHLAHDAGGAHSAVQRAGGAASRMRVCPCQYALLVPSLSCLVVAAFPRSALGHSTRPTWRCSA